MRIDWTRRCGMAAAMVAILFVLTAGRSLGDERMLGVSGDTASLYSDSGLIRNDSDDNEVIYTDVIHQPGAAWIRLSLAGTVLGNGSLIRVHSLRDGEVQHLDQSELQQWSWTSAYFNGNSVIVEMVAGGGTTNRLVIDEISWDEGEESRGGEPYCGFCEEDDREPYVDYAICRILGSTYTCTGVIVDDQSHLITAGHCMEDGTALVCQFGVPDSNNDCTINHPPVQDQFPVVTWYCSIAGVGEDWAAVVLGTNGDGDRPYDLYGTHHEMATSMPGGTPTIQVVGYGDDLDECTRADTLQESYGPLVAVQPTSLEFEADVTFGNSGSPIMQVGTNRILGLATHCPCPNLGTRIDHPGFVVAREILFGVLGNICEAAVPAALGGNSFSTVGAVDSQFGDPDESQCEETYLDWDDSPDVWMVWQPPSSGTLSLSTCEEDSFDTSLVVYAGPDCASLQQIACNGDSSDGDDDDCQSFYSAIDDLEVSPLTTYYFRLGGWQAATGSGTLWIDHVPAPATGACCLGLTCYVTLELECSDAGGTYLGSESDCTGDPCSTPITGACCTGLGFSCEELTEADCALISGDYAGDGTNCVSNTCDLMGACCVDDACQEVTQAQCQSDGGDYLGDGIPCDTESCAVPPCNGDFDENGTVNVDDLLAVIGTFGEAGTIYDLDGDGIVDVDDLLQVISAFGPC